MKWLSRTHVIGKRRHKASVGVTPPAIKTRNNASYPQSICSFLFRQNLSVTKRKTILQCLIMHHEVKTYGGMELKPNAFLTLTADGGEWSAEAPAG
jgi:hypothetical protein